MPTWNNLPGDGSVVKYTTAAGSFTFDQLIKSDISGQPVPDEAGRVNTAWEWTLRVTAIVTSTGPPNGVSNDLDAMRLALTQNAGELRYTGKGFGSGVVINPVGGGGIRDVAFGPRVTLFTFVPKGSQNAALVEWRVIFTIPEGCSTPSYQFRPQAFNWQCNTEIDGDGYTTRTISGYLLIPMSLLTAGTTTISDIADRYREQTAPAIPAGFQRMQQSFDLSADKRRISFSYIDRELTKDALPYGATKASGTHNIRPWMGSLAHWQGTISATYTIGKHLPKSKAWDNFFLLLVDRIGKANRLSDKPSSAILLDLNVTDGLYENMASTFSVSYMFPCSIPTLLLASGLYTPVPGTDYNQWKTSVSQLSGVRGYAGLRQLPSDDAIVSLCGGSTKLQTASGTTLRPFTLPRSSVLTACPRPADSWLAVQNAIDVKIINNYATHKPLVTDADAIGTFGGPKLVAQGAGGSSGNFPAPPGGGRLQNVQDAGQTGLPRMESVNVPDDIIQMRAAPTYRVRLIGWAARACYPVIIPALETFGGRPVVAKDQRVRQHTIPGASVPVLYAEWDLLYETVGSPSGAVGYPESPAEYLS